MACSLGISPVIDVCASSHVPSGASQIIDHSFASFSFPGHFFFDYSGNRSHPNLFSRDILDLLHDKTGTPPHIRVGGTSADHIIYNASQEIPVFLSNSSDNGIPDEVYVGPSWFEGFQNFPGSLWTFQVALRGTIENAVAEAQLCMDHAREFLVAFEIGNEPDIAVEQGTVPKDYTMSDYVDEWLQYADAISENVLQVYASHDHEGFSVAGAFDDGIDDTGHVKSISQHQYNLGDPPTINRQDDFMNHHAIVGNLSQYQHEINFIRSYDPPMKYVMGETNSDYVNLNMAQYEGVLGSALWLADYMLYGMTRNISNMNIIQGTTFGYAGWVPVPYAGRDPHVRAPLYGHILVADTVGHHPSVQVSEVDLGLRNFSAYAIYESEKLAKYVLVNFDEWNATTPYPRPQQEVNLAAPGGNRTQTATVKRLFGAGASADSGISWGGQSWNYTDGRLAVTGDEHHEKLSFKDGQARLMIASTEAVLVTLDK
ncbi:hypothetical protein FQN54_005891 [Arachnomyces sp. PD_36]|nr:hypothetical protein FQN54_005891 [Arachnomyces sp. PD_36]